jgi:hypothetical protein
MPDDVTSDRPSVPLAEIVLLVPETPSTELVPPSQMRCLDTWEHHPRRVLLQDFEDPRTSVAGGDEDTEIRGSGVASHRLNFDDRCSDCLSRDQASLSRRSRNASWEPGLSLIRPMPMASAPTPFRRRERSCRLWQ